MVLIYLACAVAALAGGFSGHRSWFRMERIDRSFLLNLLLIGGGLFTLLMAAYLTGYFPHEVAAPFMMLLYSTAGGFFAGYAVRLMQLRTRAGDILYMHRSFWIDHAPVLAAMLIILFGIYRTSILLEEPVTGIRFTSGVSLIAFGLFAWTVKIVPEFRRKGILFLDRILPWKHVISWSWQSEEVVAVEYLHRAGESDQEVRLLFTAVPAADRKSLESVLKSKMEEHREERERLLLGRGNGRSGG